MLIRAYRVHGPSGRRPRSAGARRAQDPQGAEARDLRLHGRRPRPADLHRQGAGPRDRHRARDPRRSCAAPTAATSASSSCTSPRRRRSPGSSERIEGEDKDIGFTVEGKKAILNKLIEAEAFEKFADVKYTGTKRFGLDGAEAMVPALEQIIKRGGQLGMKEIVIGMAHRGRLNVLGQRDGQAAPRHLQRVQGRLVQARRRRGLGRRQVSPRRLVRPRVRRQQRASVADRQPLASGDRRSRGAGQGARQAGPARLQAGRAHAGAAAADPRRCGLRRPGRGGRVLRPVRPQGPPHRRLDPFHHQQPDRLHHQPALLALLALLLGRGQDGARRRSSTSTATIPKPWCTSPRSPPSSGRSSRSRSSSTCSATAGTATTSPTSRRSPSR